MAERKTVLLDLLTLGEHDGFGEIAGNYARLFSQMDLPDIQFVFLVNERYVGRFGDKVQYLAYDRAFRKHPERMPVYDLWHSIHQRAKVRNLSDPRTKSVLTIHDIIFVHMDSWLHVALQKRALRKLVAPTDALVFISHYAQQDFNDHFPRFGPGCKRQEVILNGVTPVAIDNAAGSEAAAGQGHGERPFFFTISRLVKRKNVHVLLDMMKHFPDYDLYICGNNASDYAQAMARRIEREGLPNVFMTGPVDEARKRYLFAHARAYFFPSLLEGFGLPPIEAMQHGLPVFVADRSSLPEVCGGHAYLWQRFDADYMAEVVRAGLADFAAHPERAEAERRHAASFSYDRHIAQYIALYRSLLDA